MEIIVHYPEDNQNLNTLGEQIATLHGEFIYSYLNRLLYIIRRIIRISIP